MLFFDDLLKQRSAFILSAGERSERIDIPCSGTPQGEPSSPVIFNLLVNVFVDAVSKSISEEDGLIHAQIFADDSAIVFSSAIDNEENYLRKLNICIEIGVEYLKHSGFIVNDSKTEIMNFSKKNRI